MSPVGFEPTISAGERPQTNAFDGAATGTGLDVLYELKIRLAYAETVSEDRNPYGDRRTVKGIIGKEDIPPECQTSNIVSENIRES